MIGTDSVVTPFKSAVTMTFYFLGYIFQIPNQLWSVITYKVCLYSRYSWGCLSFRDFRRTSKLEYILKWFSKGWCSPESVWCSKIYFEEDPFPVICFLITSFLNCSCLIDCFPNTPASCHLSLLGSSTTVGRAIVWEVWVPCIAVPARHHAVWCNPVLHTSDSFPRAVMQITNNKRDVAGGKNHPCMGKFTSDWVGCLQTWKLDWGEQRRSHQLIRFAEAVLCEFSQLPGRRNIFKMGLIANLIMAAQKLNWIMKQMKAFGVMN